MEPLKKDTRYLAGFFFSACLQITMEICSQQSLCKVESERVEQKL